MPAQDGAEGVGGSVAGWSGATAGAGAPQIGQLLFGPLEPAVLFPGTFHWWPCGHIRSWVMAIGPASRGQRIAHYRSSADEGQGSIPFGVPPVNEINGTAATA